MTYQIMILKKKRWVFFGNTHGWMDGWTTDVIHNWLAGIVSNSSKFVSCATFASSWIHVLHSAVSTFHFIHTIFRRKKKNYLSPKKNIFWCLQCETIFYRSVSFNNVVICIVCLPVYVNLTCVWCGILQSLLPIFFVPLFCFEGLVTP